MGRLRAFRLRGAPGIRIIHVTVAVVVQCVGTRRISVRSFGRTGVDSRIAVVAIVAATGIAHMAVVVSVQRVP